MRLGASGLSSLDCLSELRTSAGGGTLAAGDAALLGRTRECGPRLLFWLGVDLGDLEVRKRKERCRRSHDSAPVFCVPGHLAYPLRPSRGLQRPPLARAPVTSLVGAAPVLPAPRHTHTRARIHTFGRGKLRPGRKRTPAKVTSGGGAGSGSGSVRPWTPRPAGPTLKGRALGGSARARRLREPRGRSGQAGLEPPSRGRAMRTPAG